MTRVKICGITNLRDAETAIECGAHALGFVLEPSSPRHIPDLPSVEELISKLPPYVFTVAVFGPPPSSAPPACFHAIQCVGTIDGLASRCRKWIQALRLRSDWSEQEAMGQAGEADAFLVDTYSPGSYGGTGRTTNWDVAAALRRRLSPRPLVLAGGITPENVGDAIRSVRPFAVDVGSGVEREPGLKDADKLRRLFEAVAEADSRFRS